MKEKGDRDRMHRKHARTRSILPKNFFIDNFLNDKHCRYLQHFQANPTNILITVYFSAPCYVEVFQISKFQISKTSALHIPHTLSVILASGIMPLASPALVRIVPCDSC